MASLKQLNEQRAELIYQQKDLHERANKENRDFTNDENEQWNKIETDLASIRGKIEKEEQLRRNLASISDEEIENRGGHRAPKEEQPKYADTFRKLMSGKTFHALTPEERSMAMENRGTDPQSTSPDTAGGYLIPETWSNRLIETMQAYGTLLGVASIDRPSQGGTVRYPTRNGTAETGRWVAENAQRVTSDTSFGEMTLGDHEVTSDIIRISMALAQDNNYNLEGRLTGYLGRRIGVTVGEALTVGDGVGKPRGVVLDATAGATTAAVDALTFQELIDLEHSLDPAYRNGGGNVRFMFNDNTLAAIKKLQLGSSDSRPLWTPSYREGEPDRVLGYQYVINQAMADLGASAVPVIFGDFSEYQIKMARDIFFTIFREKYMDFMQYGYMANARVDGRLLDPQAVKKLTNAAA